MPDVSGWDVLAALKNDETLRDIPVVLLTMVDDRTKGIALGASEYLTKPIDREHLARVLDRFRCEQPVNTVLMVDDDEAVRDHLGRAIRQAGWKVLEADNGRTALDLLETEVPDLVLLDLIMPELDGFGFLAELRARPDGRAIPVVVLTGADLSSDDRSQLDGQVELLIEKGAYSRSDLESEIRTLVAGYSRHGQDAE
jgi:CheY-like chemotaxis protein